MLRRGSANPNTSEKRGSCSGDISDPATLQRMQTNFEDISSSNREEKFKNHETYIPKPKKGMLDKLSSGIVKNWRTRYFHLENGIMTYFEPVHWYLKGEYDLFGLEFVEDPSDSAEIIRLKGPSTSISLRCKNLESKTRWKAAISDHIEFANEKGKAENIGGHSISRNTRLESCELNPADFTNNRFTSTIPQPNNGWLHKKGQFFPTIKRRFFVLEQGVLSYYKENVTEKALEEENQKDGRESIVAFRRSSLGKRRVPKPLGKFSIQDYEVYSDIEAGRIQIFLSPGSRSKSTRQLWVYVEDYQERDQWLKAFTEHANYQNV